MKLKGKRKRVNVDEKCLLTNKEKRIIVRGYEQKLKRIKRGR